MYIYLKLTDSQLETTTTKIYSQMESIKHIWSQRTLLFLTNKNTVLNDFIQLIANTFSNEDFFVF